MQCVLFDTEFTAWPGSMARNWCLNWEYREIIQIGALKLLVSDDAIEVREQFNILVKPTKNPELSDYIMELTGISQNMLADHGVDYHSALHMLFRFCQEGRLPLCSWGNDVAILRENAQLYSEVMPTFTGGFFDLSAWCRAKQLPQAQSTSGELARRLDIPLDGHCHNALFDVLSISKGLEYYLQHRLISVAELREWLA